MYLLCTTVEPTNVNFVNRELEQDPTSLDPICSVIYYQLTQNPANSNPFFLFPLRVHVDRVLLHYPQRRPILRYAIVMVKR